MAGAVIGEGTSTYLRVNVWRGQAEHLADSLAQGQVVLLRFAGLRPVSS